MDYAVGVFNLSPLPRNVEAALRDASHAKPDVRLSALADLSRLATASGGDRIVEKLFGVLEQDASPKVRARAAVALADSGVRVELARLESALEDPDQYVRQMVLVALGELGSQAQSKAVLKLINHEAPPIRFQALVALHHMVPSLVDELLEQKLNDSDSEVRFVAMRIAEERFTTNAREVPAWLVPCLESAYQDSVPHVRLLAAIVCHRVCQSTDTDIIVAAINRRVGLREPEDEQAAIEIAGELGLKAAVPGLERRAFGWFGISRDPFQWQARVALASMGHSRAVSTILADLKAWTWETRTLAVAAAGAAHLRPARARLLAMLGDAASANQDTIREALSQIGRD